MNEQGEVHADAAWTQPVAIPSAAAVLSAVAGTVTHGRVVTREAGRLARELLRISLGSSSVAPAKGDWRFSRPDVEREPPVPADRAGLPVVHGVDGPAGG